MVFSFADNDAQFMVGFSSLSSVTLIKVIDLFVTMLTLRLLMVVMRQKVVHLKEHNTHQRKQTGDTTNHCYIYWDAERRPIVSNVVIVA